jgi:hypothetical protein
VFCDNGCSAILLPLEEDQITDIFLKLSIDDFINSVDVSSNAVLIIKHKDAADFELKLCQDLVGNCSSNSVERLRFMPIDAYKCLP